MSTAAVVVYRTRSCPFCVGAEQLLRERSIEFDEVYLDDHPNRGQATHAILAGHRTVPLVVINGKPLGGFDDLRAADSRGELQDLVGG